MTELIKETGLVSVVRQAIESRRQVLVYETARRLSYLLQLQVREVEIPELTNREHSWVQIESLSKLRTEVGGRFQNLKQRWLAAGFPLRNHRGDRSDDADLKYQGWLELASWIGSQGYEVRLAVETDEFLFEVRKVAGHQAEASKAD